MLRRMTRVIFSSVLLSSSGALLCAYVRECVRVRMSMCVGRPPLPSLSSSPSSPFVSYFIAQLYTPINYKSRLFFADPRLHRVLFFNCVSCPPV